MATLPGLPNLITPEIVPGGLIDNYRDSRWKGIQDYINNLNVYLTTLSNTTLYLAGAGQFSSSLVIAKVEMDIAASTDTQINRGNHTFLKTPDGQLIFVYFTNAAAGTGTASSGIYAVKAKSPFTQWTALDGTSGSTAIFTQAVTNEITWCCNVDRFSGDLHVLLSATTGPTYRTCTALFDGATGNYGAVTATATSLTLFMNHDMICVSAGVMLVTTNTTTLEIWRGVQAGAVLTWTKVQDYRYCWTGAVYNVANVTIEGQGRLVQYGSNVVAFWDWTETATQHNFAFALSADNGATWSAGDVDPGVPTDFRGWGNTATTNTGNMITPFVANNGKPIQTGRPGTHPDEARWEVGLINADTGRIGFLYRRNNGQDVPTGQADTTGLYYAEWTPAAGFGTYANHIQLDPNPYNASQVLQCAGGTPRAFWLAQYNVNDGGTAPLIAGEWTEKLDIGANVSRMVYRSCLANEDGLSLLKWRTWKNFAILDSRDVAAGSTALPSSGVVNGNLTVCRDTVTVEGIECIAVVVARYDQNRYLVSESAAGNGPFQKVRIPKVDLLFKWLPIATLDSPF